MTKESATVVTKNDLFGDGKFIVEQKQPICYVESHPDEGYPLRILSAYLENEESVTTITEPAEIGEAINQASRKRAKLLREAIAKLSFPNFSVKQKELLEWANEEVASIHCLESAIADTGDYDSTFECCLHDGKKGWGKTFEEAIRDAAKSSEDPTKWDYIPPEHRW
jgi:hypothetical protein